MYISSDGRELLSSESIVADKLNTYMSVDKYDIPFMNIGIPYLFSKSNLMDAIDYLRIEANNIIDYVKDNNLSVKSVNYSDNEFIISFNYNNSIINYSISDE